VCPPGWYCPIASCGITIHGPNPQYIPRSGECTPDATVCPSGFVCMEGTAIPAPCPAGFWCAAGDEPAAPAGYVQCDAPTPPTALNGFAPQGLSLRDPVDTNKVLLLNVSGCCGRGYFCPQQSTNNQGAVRPNYLYNDTAKLTASACPAGTFQGLLAQSSASACSTCA
jgi:hypothetical protein